MKIKATQAALDKALGIVKGAVTKGAGLPITEYALLRPNKAGTSVDVIATDMNLTVKTSFEATVTDPKPICVPRDRLSNLIGLLKEDIIIETIPDNDGWARLESGRAKQKLPLKPADDFPMPDPLGKTISRRLPANIFYSMVKATGLAAAKTEQGSYTFTCVHMTLKGDKLRLEACDTKQLTFADFELPQAELPQEGEQKDIEVMLPTNSLSAIEKVLGGVKDGSDCIFTVAENFVEIETSSQKLRLRLGVGQYPDLNTVLEKQAIKTQPHHTELNPTELILAIKRASLAVEKGENKTRAVWLRFTSQQLSVEVRDRGSEADEQLSINCPTLGATVASTGPQGDLNFDESDVEEFDVEETAEEVAGGDISITAEQEVKIGLLAEKLLGCLELLDGSSITFGFTDSKKGISIRPKAEGLPFDYLYVTMPVSIAQAGEEQQQ
jgi:DNA polymerase-3 subunit beta